MKLPRLPHEVGALIDFYQESLDQLGAICERTWHDRLQLVVEGRAAKLWNDDGALHEVELHFPAADHTGPRHAATEVFPGSPLTFGLAEALRPKPLPVERAILGTTTASPPSADVAEKRWHAQFPHSARWRMETPFRAAYAFALLVVARCEIQAIDQHWSLHRMALSLPSGERDEDLAEKFAFAQIETAQRDEIEWTVVSTDSIQNILSAAIASELTQELSSIRARQENYLRRELDRIDNYFETYEAELTARSKRSGSSTKLKVSERLAAAKAEHARRREDQVKRHEIRIIPHIDALLLLAEPAWQAQLTFQQHNASHRGDATFNPRTREWRFQPHN